MKVYNEASTDYFYLIRQVVSCFLLCQEATKMQFFHIIDYLGKKKISL